MNLPITHPTWMWLYFGIFGTAGTILFTLVIWSWLRVHSVAKGALRSALKWSVIGCMFLFFGAWFACGLGGPPGNTLSPDPAMHNQEYAVVSAVLSMFFSVPGWALILVGMRKMIKAAQ